MCCISVLCGVFLSLVWLSLPHHACGPCGLCAPSWDTMALTAPPVWTPVIFPLLPNSAVGFVTRPCCVCCSEPPKANPALYIMYLFISSGMIWFLVKHSNDSFVCRHCNLKKTYNSLAYVEVPIGLVCGTAIQCLALPPHSEKVVGFVSVSSMKTCLTR